MSDALRLMHEEQLDAMPWVELMEELDVPRDFLDTYGDWTATAYSPDGSALALATLAVLGRQVSEAIRRLALWRSAADEKHAMPKI